jgi:endonuclease-8
MPEGHTIFLLAQAHRRALAKQKVAVSSPQGRFAQGAAVVDGKRLKDVRPYGKNLFYEFDNKKFVHVHLGLHGHFTLAKLKKGESPSEPRGAVRMRVVGAKAVLDLNGPIVCHVIDREGVEEVIARLGPDVLDPKADADAVKSAISRSGRTIAELLMDQSVVCGIGNAYRCELLYRQRLHPLLPGKSLTGEQLDRLWTDAVHLLKMGVRRGRAWAVDETDVDDPPMGEDGEPDRYHVYRRAKCRGCGGKVEILKLGGRKCHYCPREQKRKS